jgi:hypothetical protein
MDCHRLASKNLPFLGVVDLGLAAKSLPRWASIVFEEFPFLKRVTNQTFFSTGDFRPFGRLVLALMPPEFGAKKSPCLAERQGLANGGEGRIRTYVRYAGRFTVCCL